MSPLGFACATGGLDRKTSTLLEGSASLFRMVPSGFLLGLCVVAVAFSGLAVAHSFLTRRSDWPRLALQTLQEQTSRLEGLEQSWRTYKIGIDETLDAMDELRSRTETARKRVTASETRQKQREAQEQQPPSDLTAAQAANLMWRQHKAGRG